VIGSDTPGKVVAGHFSSACVRRETWHLRIHGQGLSDVSF